MERNNEFPCEKCGVKYSSIKLQRMDKKLFINDRGGVVLMFECEDCGGSSIFKYKEWEKV